MRFDNTDGDVCACVPSMQNRLPMLQEDDGGEGQNDDRGFGLNFITEIMMAIPISILSMMILQRLHGVKNH